MQPVLVVDDEQDLLSMLRDILEISGYSVVTATNGREALDYLLSERPKPSLILLDLTMPIMNGLRFLEELHSGAHSSLVSIPVVVISAVEEFIQLNQFQCAGIIKKPASLESILGIAQRFAHKH